MVSLCFPIFFHPDCTVGFGVSPNHIFVSFLARSRFSLFLPKFPLIFLASCQKRRVFKSSRLRSAAQTRACRMAGRTGSHLQQRKTGSSRWGTPCLTYHVWIFAGCVLFRGAPCFCFILTLPPHGAQPHSTEECRSFFLKNKLPRRNPLKGLSGKLL